MVIMIFKLNRGHVHDEGVTLEFAYFGHRIGLPHAFNDNLTSAGRAR